MICTRIEDSIGNTPLLKLDSKKYGLKNSDIYVKLEYLNPFGSVKDRTVTGMLSPDTLQSLSHEKRTLIESSSGNTAKAMQLLASKYGIKFTSVTNRIKVPEVEDVLRYLGADIIALPGRSECADPNNPDDAVATIKRMVEENPELYFHTSQYTNTANRRVHKDTTASEIYTDLSHVDIFVTGVGTGGSSGGIIDYAKEHDYSTRFLGVMSEPSDFLPGIRTRRELFETELFSQNDFDELHEVTSLDALDALRQLVRNEGVLAGPTTGASFAAALHYLRMHDERRADGSRQTLVLIACDRLETYMSYIKKRQPQLFGDKSKTDIYAPAVHGAEKYSMTATSDTVEWIQQKSVTIIDLRSVKPFTAFHIDGSLNYPEAYLSEILSEGEPFSPSRQLLIVCPTGERSARLTSILRARGLQAYNLSGGLLEWRKQQLPLARKTL